MTLSTLSTLLAIIVAALTILGTISGWFYVAIYPLRHSITLLNRSFDGLKKMIEDSITDRRILDARIAALEEGHKINLERIMHLEEKWDNSNGN